MAIEGISSLEDPKSFAEAEKYIQKLLSSNEYSSQNTRGGDIPGANNFSPKAYITYVNDILDEMSRGSKGLQFALSQTALHILNPEFGQGQFWNPVALIGGPPPGLTGLMTDSLDVFNAGNNPGSDKAISEDKLLQMYEGKYEKLQAQANIPPVEQIGPNTLLSDGMTIPQKIRDINIFNNEKNSSNVVLIDLEDGRDNQIAFDNKGVVSFKPDFESLFLKYDKGPAFGGPALGANYFRPNQNAKRTPSQKYKNAVSAMSNHDAYFNAFDAENGYVEDNNSFISDDDAYVPFYFEDTRKIGRYVFFRAFIKSISESIAPEWNIEKYYGRVDPVGVYMNTSRTFSISFSVVAFSQAGLTAMWRKISNLIKMLYPTYENGILKKAPVVRLRIGDLIADGAGLGLPGFITSFDADYQPYNWDTSRYGTRETETGKVPMGADISFSFQVIHEQQPHNDPEYNFDTGIYRRMGQLPTDLNNILANDGEEE